MSNTNANNNKPNNSNNKTNESKEKKVINVILGIILGICVIATVVVGITAYKNTTPHYNSEPGSMLETNEKWKTEDTTETTTETTTQDLIEESGAIEICSGSDAEGNEYKLVCTQEESYDKVTVKVGVIKNNQWLQKLSTKSPFINEEGTNLIGLDGLSPRDSQNFDKYYHYIANGVFVVEYYASTKIILGSGSSNGYEYLFYNSNNKRSITLTDLNGIKFTFDHPYSKFIVFSRDYAHSYGDYSICFLNTETMEENVIIDKIHSNIIGGYSEGLFLLSDGFYNLKGEKVIDMQKYNISGYYNYYGSDKNDSYPAYKYFVDGGFKFCVENSAGTIYNMEIDKKGNLIKNEVSPYQKQ